MNLRKLASGPSKHFIIQSNRNTPSLLLYWSHYHKKAVLLDIVLTVF